MSKKLSTFEKYYKEFNKQVTSGQYNISINKDLSKMDSNERRSSLSRQSSVLNPKPQGTRRSKIGKERTNEWLINIQKSQNKRPRESDLSEEHPKIQRYEEEDNMANYDNIQMGDPLSPLSSSPMNRYSPRGRQALMLPGFSRSQAKDGKIKPLGFSVQTNAWAHYAKRYGGNKKTGYKNKSDLAREWKNKLNDILKQGGQVLGGFMTNARYTKGVDPFNRDNRGRGTISAIKGRTGFKRTGKTLLTRMARWRVASQWKYNLLYTSLNAARNKRAKGPTGGATVTQLKAALTAMKIMLKKNRKQPVYGGGQQGGSLSSVPLSNESNHNG